MESSDANKAEAYSAVEDTTTTTVQDDDDTNVPTNCSANSRRCFLCKARASSKSSTELMMKAAAAEGEEGQHRDCRRPVNLAIGLKYVCDVLELDDVIPTTSSAAAANTTAFCFFCSGVMLDILKDLSEIEALRKKLDVRVRILKSRVASKEESTVESFGDDDNDVDIVDVNSGGEEIGKE
jgi:hypothetical protein